MIIIINIICNSSSNIYCLYFLLYVNFVILLVSSIRFILSFFIFFPHSLAWLIWLLMCHQQGHRVHFWVHAWWDMSFPAVLHICLDAVGNAESGGSRRRCSDETCLGEGACSTLNCHTEEFSTYSRDWKWHVLIIIGCTFLASHSIGLI